MKISIKNMIVVSLIIFLLVALKFEQHRADSLQSQVAALQQPALDAIARQKLLVNQFELQLDYARKTIEPVIAGARAAGGEMADQNQLLEAGFPGTFQLPVGLRRELANLRNMQLKLERERTRLQTMIDEFD